MIHTFRHSHGGQDRHQLPVNEIEGKTKTNQKSGAAAELTTNEQATFSFVLSRAADFD